MFSLFKKKATSAGITDIVFAAKDSKWKALSEVAKQNRSTVFVAWFEDSREALQQYFEDQQVGAEVIMYRELHGKNEDLVFIEHYPLAQKEKELFNSLALKTISVYSSLDEALFQLFGGDKIASLLTKSGLDDNEGITHTMITQSIYKAQEKLAGKVTIDQSANSMEEWVQKNVGGGLT